MPALAWSRYDEPQISRLNLASAVSPSQDPILYVGVGTVQSHKVELELCAPASPPAGPPGRVLLPNTYTQDGWFLQPKRRPGQLGFLAGSPSAAERLCIVVPCSTYITSE